jgi:hypothetical protein
MSVAAAEALALRDLLRDGREDIARRFFRAAEEIVDIPWTTVLGNDLRFPDAEGPRSPELERAREYMDAFRVAVADDLVLSTALVRVLNMVDAPSRLRCPGAARTSGQDPGGAVGEFRELTAQFVS